MIVTGTGYSPSATEFIDVINGKTCENLAKFPKGVWREAVGGNLQGTPVVCGGYGPPIQGSDTVTDSDICYKLTMSGWKSFAKMKFTRRAAAGITYNDKFHVFGGTNKYSHRRITSEIISTDGMVVDGPELPLFEISNHGITAINQTVSIISGGESNPPFDYVDWTQYYNHETEEFTDGPNLLEARTDHGSATYVDKVTKARIPIVAGGKAWVGTWHGTTDSTERLIGGQWQKGIIFNLKSRLFRLL